MKYFFPPAYLILLVVIIIVSYCTGFSGNDILKIDCKSYGCFKSEQSELIIRKKGSDTFATFTIKGEKTYEQKINASQIRLVNKVVKRVEFLNERAGCTTIEYFTIYTKDGITQKVDKACSNNGFYELRNVLFKL